MRRIRLRCAMKRIHAATGGAEREEIGGSAAEPGAWHMGEVYGKPGSKPEGLGQWVWSVSFKASVVPH